MTSSTTVTTICNMALDMLHEGPITSIDDDEPNARRFKRNFDNLRDSFLEIHPWNFAVKSATIAKDATDPAFGWDHRYLMPGDMLRLLPLRSRGVFEGKMMPHEIEDGYILTDLDTPIKVRYIYRNESYGSWSPTAIMTFARYLAKTFAHAITGKASMAEMQSRMFTEELRMAKRMDGMQGMSERADTTDVITVRGGYERWNYEPDD